MSHSDCKPVNIPNEFITTLLTSEQKQQLQSINEYLTEKITECVCPVGAESIFRPLPAPSSLISKDASGKPCCDAITPTNNILYGTSICQNLFLLNLSGLSNEDIKRLNLQYKVIWPWSLEYHSDRLGNNKRLQYFPLIIAFPRSVTEVSFWIGIARDHGFTLSIRSGGHNYEGFCNSGQMIIDTTDLKLDCDQSYNIQPGYVDVAPGVRLGTLYDALVKENVLIAGGICPSVCVGGLIAGGGVGYFLRQFGYACDNLLEVDIVLATGEKITVKGIHPDRSDCSNRKIFTDFSERKPITDSSVRKSNTDSLVKKNIENNDLFRAIKGAGGGNFGVITRYRLKTHKVRRVVYFTYSFAAADTVTVLNALQKVGINCPDNLSGIVGNMVAGVPGITVNGVYNPVDRRHPIAEFNIIIQSNFFSLMPGVTPTDSQVKYQNWAQIDTDLGFEAPPLPFYKTRSNYSFRLLSLEELQTIVDGIAMGPVSNNTMFFALQYVVFGGFINRVDPKTSVMVARAGTKGWIQEACYYSDPNDLNIAVNYVNRVYDIIAPLTSIHADPNASDLELTDPLLSYYGANNVSFLKDVKKTYDPDNLFTFPQSIPLE